MRLQLLVRRTSVRLCTFLLTDGCRGSERDLRALYRHAWAPAAAAPALHVRVARSFITELGSAAYLRVHSRNHAHPSLWLPSTPRRRRSAGRGHRRLQRWGLPRCRRLAALHRPTRRRRHVEPQTSRGWLRWMKAWRAARLLRPPSQRTQSTPRLGRARRWRQACPFRVCCGRLLSAPSSFILLSLCSPFHLLRRPSAPAGFLLAAAPDDSRRRLRPPLARWQWRPPHQQRRAAVGRALPPRAAAAPGPSAACALAPARNGHPCGHPSTRRCGCCDRGVTAGGAAGVVGLRAGGRAVPGRTHGATVPRCTRRQRPCSCVGRGRRRVDGCRASGRRRQRSAQTEAVAAALRCCKW